jgi:magnesium chelatase subunit D
VSRELRPETSPWADAALAAALLAVDPAGMGGAALRAQPGPVRDRWLGLLRELLPASSPVRKVPLQVGADRLLGGLDLAATLSAGRPVIQQGLLAEANGGVLLLAMAERIEPACAAQIASTLDAGEIRLERDGFAETVRSCFGVVALDEGVAADERPAAALLDRLAFHLDLGDTGIRDAVAPSHGPDEVEAARARLPAIEIAEEDVEALCAASVKLGIASIRAPLLALCAARAATSLAGRRKVGHDDLVAAARLVLVSRAITFPAEEDRSETREVSQPETSRDDAPGIDQPLEERVLAAALATMPEGLLARLKLRQSHGAAHAPGRAGALRKATQHGRPIGARRGMPRAGVRLDLVETLRAAAPWQKLRRSDQGRIALRPDDLRVRRLRQKTRTTTIFVVDASGSAALHRLSEAKGAVELLLADCYVRRDEVALLAFRGARAELLLPPTRSLARARRSLASLPGGGGTPLASGIDAAALLADAIRYRGHTPVLMLLTDGRGNVARDGTGGRERAEQDAIAAARMVRAQGVQAILVDTSARPEPAAERLAAEMGALYLALPYADATLRAVPARARRTPA